MNENSYRMASWWIKWEDLAWPDRDLKDKIRRRADLMAAGGVNTAIIFGAHFRWDFMPLWGNLHDMMHHIADELHERGVRLFDHHSSVLVHRYDNRQDMLDMRRCNRHHVPFAPDRRAADAWTYRGMKLNDWRMIDVRTGQAVRLPAYTAEEFCINNPDFAGAYLSYVKLLLEETGIDGLMSDDGIFYSNLTSCGCAHCRERFRREYGRELPPVADGTFWGNWKSPAFRDWLEMRSRSTGDFVVAIKEVLPPDFPFMTCCSNSIDVACAGAGMSYLEFIRGCNMVMLEMCGNTPKIDGTLGMLLPVQLQHLGIAREHNVPCIGLGYGFSAGTAGVIWAFNKFLGSDCWFSTKKGRLGLPDSNLVGLPDDPEVVARPYNFEKANPELFAGTPDSPAAIYFSNATRNFYGGNYSDYTADYVGACNYLFAQDIQFDVVNAVPKSSSGYSVLVLPSAACLSDEDCRNLEAWLASGKTLLATGPLGVCSARGEHLERQFTEKYGLRIELPEIDHPPVFPPDWTPKPTAECLNEPQWHSVTEHFFWHPGRMGAENPPEFASLVKPFLPLPILETPTADGWMLRRFKTADGGFRMHGLAAHYRLEVDEELEALRDSNWSGLNVITGVGADQAARRKRFKVNGDFEHVNVYFPLRDRQVQCPVTDGAIEFDIPDGAYYFIVSR